MTVPIKYLFYGLFLITNLSFIANGMNGENIQLPLGRWEVYKYKIGRDPTALTMGEIKSMKGKTILLKEKVAIILGDTCNLPSYKMHMEGDDYLIANFNADKKFLNLNDSKIQVLSLDCNSEPHYLNKNLARDFSYDFIITSKTTMIFDVGGDFFYVKKVN